MHVPQVIYNHERIEFHKVASAAEYDDYNEYLKDNADVDASTLVSKELWTWFREAREYGRLVVVTGDDIQKYPGSYPYVCVGQIDGLGFAVVCDENVNWDMRY